MPAAAARRKTRQKVTPKDKTDQKSSVVTPVGQLVPQPHGGALSPGNPGNKGGPGRPPNRIREMLRELSEQHVPELARIASGEVTIKLRHACEFCGKEPSEGAPTVDEVLKQAASPMDRRNAIDTMLKYGIGQLKEVSVENVRERVEETLRIIGLHCSTEQAETLYHAIEPVWK